MSLVQAESDFDGLIEEVILDLDSFEGLPRRALKTAADNWEILLPEFLEMLEAYVRDPEANGEAERALFLVVHLFGQMRERRAYRPLTRLLRMDPPYVEAVLGDAATETLHQVLISVFDGDPQPLRAVIEDADADEFVRSRAFDALAFLAKEGRIDLEDVKSFLLRCYSDLQPQRECMVWVGWQSAIAYLGLAEFRSLVRKAFASGKISRFHMDYDDFAKDLRRAVVGSGSGYDVHADLRPFGDVVEEIGHWHCFSEEYFRVRERIQRAWERAREAAVAKPHVNVYRDVGRNDPCPCGSGRKFKKCCLH
ncbi:MAG: DUF1186 domain-containing protein [Kiloniellaceae bacterium]